MTDGGVTGVEVFRSGGGEQTDGVGGFCGGILVDSCQGNTAHWPFAGSGRKAARATGWRQRQAHSRQAQGRGQAGLATATHYSRRWKFHGGTIPRRVLSVRTVLFSQLLSAGGGEGLAETVPADGAAEAGAAERKGKRCGMD